MNLAGKVALVTGAAAGLGKAIALAFARAGGRLAVCDISEKGLAETRAEVEALGAKCLALHCDISSSAEVASMFNAICAAYGTVHVLVNNAAMIPARPEDEARRNKHYAYLTTPVPRQSLGFTSSMTDEEWLRFWNVNVHGVFYCTREALRRMEPQRDGKIVNIASIAGLSTYSAHSPHYSATKGAVIAFTRSVVSFSAVTKMTGMLFVRGSRLMRRQTSKPVDRSSTPRSPAGIETSRIQRSGRCSKQAASADGPSDAAMARADHGDRFRRIVRRPRGTVYKSCVIPGRTCAGPISRPGRSTR